MDEWFIEMASCLDIPVNAYIHSNIDINRCDKRMKQCDNIVIVDEHISEHPSKAMIDDTDCTLIVWDGYEAKTQKVVDILKDCGKQGKIMDIGVLE